VLIDGEPGYTQIKMAKRSAAGNELPAYDDYYSVGWNVGTERSSAPTAGRRWRHIFHPVAVDLFADQPIDDEATFTTIMNWQAHEPIEFNGATYGQKDAEFSKFIDLPGRVRASFELAIAGRHVPVERLREAGWRLCDAHAVTRSFDSYQRYLGASLGEFAVSKQVFVATTSGWFSDRSAAYLASGRPVVLQETGFSDHLPCGEGLFAVATVDEAAAAIEAIRTHPERHSRRAREIAAEHLNAAKVLGAFLDELGIR
jgi:hypothetical protein